MVSQFWQVRLYCRHPDNFGPHCEVHNHDTEADARAFIERCGRLNHVHGFVLEKCTRETVDSHGATSVDELK